MAELQQAWDRISAAAYDEEGSYKVYSEWAGEYERDVKLAKRVSNMEMAKHAVKVFRNDESSLLLDVAAGTGLMGEAMRQVGFKGIMDGIDINETMLQKAREKGIYRNLICKEVSPVLSLPVANDTYDAITTCGGIVHNHMEAGCIRPIIHALKSGGVFVFNTRDTDENSCMKDAIEEILDRMVEEERINYNRRKVQHYLTKTAETGGIMFALLYTITKL